MRSTVRENHSQSAQSQSRAPEGVGQTTYPFDACLQIFYAHGVQGPAERKSPGRLCSLSLSLLKAIVNSTRRLFVETGHLAAVVGVRRSLSLSLLKAIVNSTRRLFFDLDHLVAMIGGRR